MPKQPTSSFKASSPRTINASAEAEKFLQRLQKGQIKHARQITRKMLELGENSLPQDARPLQGFEEIYRVDAGEYRIIYRFDETTLYIEIIGKRNDSKVYKNLANKLN